jgi:hypothetical protein
MKLNPWKRRGFSESNRIRQPGITLFLHWQNEALRAAVFACVQVGARYDRPGRHRMNVACSE